MTIVHRNIEPSGGGCGKALFRALVYAVLAVFAAVVVILGLPSSSAYGINEPVMDTGVQSGNGQAQVKWKGESLAYCNAAGNQVKWDLFTGKTAALSAQAVGVETTYGPNNWEFRGWATNRTATTPTYLPGDEVDDSYELFPVYARKFVSGVSGSKTAYQYYNPRQAQGSQYTDPPQADTTSFGGSYGWSCVGWLASKSGTSGYTTPANMGMNTTNASTNKNAGTFYAIYERTAQMVFEHGVSASEEDQPTGGTASVPSPAVTQGYNSGTTTGTVTTNPDVEVALPDSGFSRQKYAVTRSGSNVIWIVTTYPTAAGTTQDANQGEKISWTPGLCAPANATAVVKSWYRTKCDISFVANGGTGEMATVRVNANEPYTVPACTFEKPSFYSREWNTAADGSGTTYPIGGSLAPTEDMTLYAQWLPDVNMPVAGVSNAFLMIGIIWAASVAAAFFIALTILLRRRRKR